MVFVCIVAVMFTAVAVGKRAEKFGKREFFIAALLAVILVAAALYHMFTMEKPPMY